MKKIQTLEMTAYISVIAIATGACFIGSAYGWRVGIGVGLIAWGLREIEKE
jgi:hypothetical protein